MLLKENATGYRYGRVDIVDPTNPDGYVQIGRLFVGPALVPTVNVDYTWSLGLADPGESVVSPFRRTFMDDRGPASRIMQLALCLNPAATAHFHRHTGQFRFESLQARQGLPYFNTERQVWQKTLIQVEIL